MNQQPEPSPDQPLADVSLKRLVLDLVLLAAANGLLSAGQILLGERAFAHSMLLVAVAVYITVPVFIRLFATLRGFLRWCQRRAAGHRVENHGAEARQGGGPE